MKSKMIKMMMGTLCAATLMSKPVTLSNEINESRETTNQSNTETGADNRVKIFYTDSKAHRNAGAKAAGLLCCRGNACRP